MLKGWSKKQKAALGTVIGVAGVALCPVIGIPVTFGSVFTAIGALIGAN